MKNNIKNTMQPKLPLLEINLKFEVYMKYILNRYYISFIHINKKFKHAISILHFQTLRTQNMAYLWHIIFALWIEKIL